MNADRSGELVVSERPDAAAPGGPPDPLSEDLLNHLARLAGWLLRAPVVFVRALGQDRLSVIGNFGDPHVIESGRSVLGSLSPCQIVIETNAPVRVTDIRADSGRSSREALIARGLVAYLGVPLRNRSGAVIGSFCVLDRRPRRWTPANLRALEDLAALAATELETRGLIRSTEEQLGVAERERHERNIILESTVEGIYGLDRNGRCTFINRTGAATLGYEPDDLLGEPMHEIVHPKHADGSPYPLTECPIHRVIEGGEGARIDAEIFWRQDGTSFPAECFAAPMRVNGQIVGLVVTFVDISERLRAEQARQLLDSLSQTFTASLDQGEILRALTRELVPTLADWAYIGLLDENGTPSQIQVETANPQVSAILAELDQEYPITQLGDQPLRRVLWTGRPELIAEVTPEVNAAQTRDRRHFALVQSLGIRSYLCVPLIARGRTFGAIGLVMGASDRRYGPRELDLATEITRRASLALDNARLYREAQEAIQARNEFLSVAAHELKTPLTGLKGSAQLLLRIFARGGDPSPEQLRRTLRTIDQQSDRLASLVAQLLDVTRIEAGKLALSPEEVDLAGLIERLIEPTRIDASRHPIVMRTNGSARACVDVSRFEQVFSNLLDNAIKYSPDGGVIELDIGESPEGPGAIRISVRDHGLGIPEERRAHIFDRFYQAHTKGYFSGMGLGLYISKEIVNRHGGTLSAEFPDDGGTRFVVTLPAPNRRSVI